jgi:hypothetical protein
MEKSAMKFKCDACDFNCGAAWQWNRHIATRKHRNALLLNENPSEKCAAEPEPIKKKTFVCDNCNKVYMAKNSLWYHKKQCQTVTVMVGKEEVDISDVLNPTQTIIELLKQNQELQKQLIEISKEPKVTNNITQVTNSNNNQFNLNMFLNEECRNALNIMDFVNSLNLTVTDLEQTGKLGFVEGISRIFINALKNTDVCMRPIHCTDIKRETVYVKDQDKWEKENDNKKMKMALDQIARKNLKLLPEWQQQHPEFRYLDTPENETFMKISLSSLGAEHEEEQAKLDKKILRNVLKEVILEKNQ